jgi:hypothetical protein
LVEIYFQSIFFAFWLFGLYQGQSDAILFMVLVLCRVYVLEKFHIVMFAAVSYKTQNDPC